MSKSADKIIENSISLFRAQGFAGTSVSDIATATGILKGSLYSHFSSKEMILLEVIQRVETIFFDYIQLKALLQITTNGKLKTVLAKGAAYESFPWSTFSGGCVAQTYL